MENNEDEQRSKSDSTTTKFSFWHKLLRFLKHKVKQKLNRTQIWSSKKVSFYFFYLSTGSLEALHTSVNPSKPSVILCLCISGIYTTIADVISTIEPCLMCLSGFLHDAPIIFSGPRRVLTRHAGMSTNMNTVRIKQGPHICGRL